MPDLSFKYTVDICNIKSLSTVNPNIMEYRKSLWENAFLLHFCISSCKDLWAEVCHLKVKAT